MSTANPLPITPAIQRLAREATDGISLPESAALVMPIAQQQRGAGVSIFFAAYTGCDGTVHDLKKIGQLKQQYPGIQIYAINVNGDPKYMPLFSSVPGKHVDFPTRGEAIDFLSEKFNLSITSQKVAVVVPGRPNTLLDSKTPSFTNQVGQAIASAQRGVSRQ